MIIFNNRKFLGDDNIFRGALDDTGMSDAEMIGVISYIRLHETLLERNKIFHIKQTTEELIQEEKEELFRKGVRNIDSIYEKVKLEY